MPAELVLPLAFTSIHLQRKMDMLDWPSCGSAYGRLTVGQGVCMLCALWLPHGTTPPSTIYFVNVHGTSLGPSFSQECGITWKYLCCLLSLLSRKWGKAVLLMEPPWSLLGLLRNSLCYAHSPCQPRWEPH